jgi:hypothetical protein
MISSRIGSGRLLVGFVVQSLGLVLASQLVPKLQMPIVLN